jgi:hypothetical protein
VGITYELLKPETSEYYDSEKMKTGH